MQFDTFNDEFVPNKKVNVFLAAYVTGNARQRLTEALKIFPKEQLLYCDTDSVAYIEDSTNPDFVNVEEKLSIGMALGQWSYEEMKQDGRKVKGAWTKFCSVGPKMYMLMNGDDKESIKMASKGIKSNIASEKLLQFSVFKYIATNPFAHWLKTHQEHNPGLTEDEGRAIFEQEKRELLGGRDFTARSFTINRKKLGNVTSGVLERTINSNSVKRQRFDENWITYPNY